MAEPAETWSERFERELGAVRGLLRRRPLAAIVFLLAIALYGWHQFLSPKSADESTPSTKTVVAPTAPQTNNAPPQVSDLPIVDDNLGIEWTARSSSTMMTWDGALTYCRDLVSGGQTDWRLPSKREHESIVNQELLDKSPGSNVVPLYGPFSTNTSGYLFSGTAVPGYEGAPWIMNIRNGHVFNGEGYEAFAWCVRDPRFISRRQ